MPEAVISDTSCFIVLTKIGELELLHLTYGSILTTPEIEAEFGEPLPEWVSIQAATDNQLQQILELQLDKGEASAIVLAMEIPGVTIILDDIRARKSAEKLGLAVTGTIGMIIKAKLKGIIPSIKPYLNRIRETDFRITPELQILALQQAGE